MIKNERQYRITKTQAASFASAIAQVAQQDSSDLHPLAKEVQREALQSQLDDLEEEIAEYEALLRDRPVVIEASTLDDLPRALIRARIALGLTQKDLAERMGLKEQQIQRYEATEYSSISLTKLKELADSLGIRISESLSLPMIEPNKEGLFARLDTAGIDQDFLIERILPTDVAINLDNDDAEAKDGALRSAMSVLSRIYGWSVDSLCASVPLAINEAATATARFKVPGGNHGRRFNAYIVYAHYIAMVVASASRDLPKTTLTSDPREMWAALTSNGDRIDLRTVLHHFWDAGVPVVPMDDSGVFHGANWRINGRNVIVVKQKSKFLSRWIFDLLHEWHHASASPEDASHSWIEESAITSTRRNSPEEKAASQFAGNVVTNCQAEVLARKCAEASGGALQRLKSVVPDIAREAGIEIDHLANYLAWRLSLQGENWWGTANNLQTQIGDPHQIAADVFYQRFNFKALNPVDMGILARAIGRAGDE